MAPIQMRIIYALLPLLLMLTGCKTQNTFPKDWDMEALKGKPKKITEISKYGQQESRLKKISYYNESGNLMKTEEFNEYNYSDDSFGLTQITYYSYPENNTSRTAVTFKKNTKDTVNTRTYTMVDDTTIIAKNKDKEDKLITSLEQKLDKANRLIQNKFEIIDTEESISKMNSSIDFIYSDDGLEKLIIKNKMTKPEGNEIVVINEKNDATGNPVYYEYSDENKNAIYSVEREYEYY